MKIFVKPVLLPYLFGLFIIASCVTTTVQPKLGTSFSYFVGASYDPYKTGHTDEQKIKQAIADRKKYPKNTSVVLNYNHTHYSFSFQKDSLRVAKPIAVDEYSECMATTLYDNESFGISESFNDEVQFIGFRHNYSEEFDSAYVKSTYVDKPVMSSGIFYSDARSASASWSLPAPGATVRVRTEKKHEDAKYFTMIYFHESYYQDERIITLKIPKWLNVEFVDRNFEGFDIIRTDSAVAIGRIITLKTADEIAKSNSGKSSKSPKTTKKAKPVKEDTAQFKYVTYVAKNLTALKKENLFPGYTHDLPHVLVYVKTYDSIAVNKTPVVKTTTTKNNKKVTTEVVKPKDKNKKVGVNKAPELPENLKGTIANTADLYQWCYEIAKLADNKIDSVKPMALKITEGKKTDYDKVEAIYYWVQDNIKYIAYEDGIAAFKPDNCQNVLAKRYGDCKGMANLIKCLLVSLGYDARLTWIGTHRLNLDYSMPIVSNSNHLICSIVLNGKRYFLDGTENFIGMGDYAHRIQGRPVMIEDGNNYIIDTIPNLSYLRNLHERIGNFKIMPDGKIVGELTERMNGENKTSLLNTYHYTETEEKPYVLKKHLKDYDPNFDVTNISSTDFNNRNIELGLSYNLAINHNSVVDGKKIYFKPDFIGELTNHANDTNRLTRLAYAHKLYYTHQYTFALPQKYAVVSLPDEFEVSRPEYTIKAKITKQGNNLVYHKTIIFNTGYVLKPNIKAFNADVENLEKFYNQYVVIQQ